MIAELVLSYVALGVTYIAMQAYQGAGAFLGRKLAEDARAVPPALLPLLGFIVSLIVVLFAALTLVVWPYFAWDDFRKGVLFDRDRWDDKE